MYKKITKFIFGWFIWIMILIINIIFSLLTWNWKETVNINMKNIIIEICGKTTWIIMTGDYN